jgi:hypothetical protein
MLRRVSGIAAVISCAGVLVSAVNPCNADTVVLVSGRKLEGRVEDHDGAMISVEMKYGTVRIPRKQVARIEKNETLMDRYREEMNRARASGERAAQAFFELAAWCADNDMPNQRLEALAAAVASDPDHEGAREALGYVKHEGRWVSRDERNGMLGLVRFEGRWVPPEARDDAISARKNAGSKSGEDPNAGPGNGAAAAGASGKEGRAEANGASPERAAGRISESPEGKNPADERSTAEKPAESELMPPALFLRPLSASLLDAGGRVWLLTAPLILRTGAFVLVDEVKREKDAGRCAPDLPVTPGTVPAYPAPAAAQGAAPDGSKGGSKSPPPAPPGRSPWTGPGLPNPFPSSSR